MFLFKTLLAASVFASVVIAESKLAFTEWPSSIKAGEPVTLKWIGATEAPATITLRKGPSNDLKDVQVLTTDARSGSFTFIPEGTLADAPDYAFQITQGDAINYSGLIKGSGTTDAPAPDAPPPAGQAPPAPPTILNTIPPDQAAPARVVATATQDATEPTTIINKAAESTSPLRMVETIVSGTVSVSTSTPSPVAATTSAAESTASRTPSGKLLATGGASVLASSPCWLMGALALVACLGN